MRKLKFLLCALMLAMPVFANEADDRQTATSLKYVTHELDTRQDKLSAGQNQAIEYTDSAGDVEQRTVESNLSGANDSLPTVDAVTTGLNTKQNAIAPIDDHTAVTYTGQTGGISTKGIYQSTGTYAEQSDNLIDAKTFNAALKNGLDNEFVCDEDNKQPGTGRCWLWKIHNSTENTALPPTAYVPLEYIEADGTQYIDTGITQDTLDFKVSMDASFSTSHRVIFGVSSNSPMYFGHAANSKFEMNQLFTSLTTTPYERAHMEWGKNQDNSKMNLTVTVGGQSETLISDMFGGVTNNNFVLFANNVGNVSNGNSILHGRIYYCKIYKGGALVFDGIPAKQGDTIGIYDKVSNTFKPSVKPNTNFAPGPTINVYIPQGQ